MCELDHTYNVWPSARLRSHQREASSMGMSSRDYLREFADEKRSEAARRGAVTRENRAKAYAAWLRKARRETGREPTPDEIREATDRIRREVSR